MRITFFDDKTEPVSPQNWIVAAMSRLYGHIDLGLICDERQQMHLVMAEKYPDVRVTLFRRERFYEQDSAELRLIEESLMQDRQLVWHVSHYENDTSPTLILHQMAERTGRTGLLIKTGTVRGDFTAENYYPEQGKHVARIFAVSQHTKGHIMEVCGVPADQISVNYMGIDRRLFNPEERVDRAHTRARFGLPEQGLITGLVGSLEHRKNVFECLDVLATVCRDHPEFYVAFVGMGSLEAQLRARIGELQLTDRVLLLGHQRDVAGVMTCLDILSLYSKREGAVPRVLLEAKAMGVCPVAVDLGGISEALEHAVDGFLIPAGDVAAYERAIRELVTDEQVRRAMSEQAMRSVQKLDREAQITQFCDEVLAIARAR